MTKLMHVSNVDAVDALTEIREFEDQLSEEAKNLLEVLFYMYENAEEQISRPCPWCDGPLIGFLGDWDTDVCPLCKADRGPSMPSYCEGCQQYQPEFCQNEDCGLCIDCCVEHFEDDYDEDEDD